MSFFDIKQPSWTNSPASFLGEPFFFKLVFRFPELAPMVDPFFWLETSITSQGVKSEQFGSTDG